ncbi:hypothetical protein GCM10010191_01120 [Actinomadura vinacea]|uniref:Uncharacterized protein n=1 Tax=Actinomadura vinacea TaxID=115336 RepID=A0ABN3I957_9ACTN
MAKNRNGMLGVGGQRKNISRKALRGGVGKSSSNETDALAQKKELLERMRTRNAGQPQNEQPQNEQAENENES